MRRQKVMERKEEPGHARRHRARQKERSPATESFRGKQPESDNESRADPRQAQDDVHESECRHSCSWMIQPTEKIQSAASKRNFQVRFLALRPLRTKTVGNTSPRSTEDKNTATAFDNVLCTVCRSRAP